MNKQQKKLLTTEEREYINNLKIFKYNERITNPHSGARVELEPTAVAIYDTVIGGKLLLNTVDSEYIQLVGRDIVITRMKLGLRLFKKLWPKEFILLLDYVKV